MTPLLAIQIVALAAMLILLLRILLPWSRGIYRRSRLHGPVAGAGPGGAGNFWGWILSAFWSVGETKREEQYEYMRPTLPTAAPKPTVSWEPIRVEVRERETSPLPPSESELPRSEQVLTDDRRLWWSGRSWVPVDTFVPPSAPRSVDGSQWWDGEQWQWLPGEWAPPSTWAPQLATGRSRQPRSESSWLLTRRGHLEGRKVQPRLHSPDRSDPPPDWMGTQ